MLRRGFVPHGGVLQSRHFQLFRSLSSSAIGDDVLSYWKNVLLGRAPHEEQAKAVKDLCAAAISVHRGRAQNLFPDELITLFRGYYTTLDSEGKRKLFHSLATNFGVDETEVSAAVTAWQRQAQSNPPRAEALLKACERLHQASEPMFNRLWQPLSQDRDGLLFLVDLRSDLLECIKEVPAGAAVLRAMSEGLRRALVGWFTVGLMKLERVEWNRTSGAMLEKVSLDSCGQHLHDHDCLE